MPEEASCPIDWPAHMDAWKASGLTQVAYCRQHQLNAHQFSYWKRKLIGPRTSTGGRTVSGNLIPVQLTAATASPSLLKAYLPNGICLEGDSPAGLSTLIKLLRTS